jgi:hypothetical protein
MDFNYIIKEESNTDVLISIIERKMLALDIPPLLALNLIENILQYCDSTSIFKTMPVNRITDLNLEDYLDELQNHHNEFYNEFVKITKKWLNFTEEELQSIKMAIEFNVKTTVNSPEFVMRINNLKNTLSSMFDE